MILYFRKFQLVHKSNDDILRAPYIIFKVTGLKILGKVPAFF